MPKITDLSKIPPPDVVEQIDYEQILARRKQQFVEQYDNDADRQYWAGTLELESEPVVKLLEECAYNEMIWRAELNEAAQSLMLAYAAGRDLDQIAANYDIKRFVIQAADNAVNPPVEEILETDSALRVRIQKAFEALSTAGPKAAYETIAINAHAHVKDVSAVSPSGAVVDIAVLSNQGDGTATEDVLSAVRAAVNDKYKRPLADRVTVKSAEIINFAVKAKIYVYPTPDYEPVLAEARARLAVAIAENSMIGRDVSPSMIYAALKVEGVQHVELSEPSGYIAVSDMQAANCTEVSVEYGGENE
ncbi:baseplate assembly protein [Neisseria sp. S1]|uniref:baseplate assembly protein n=1 Tax=Neisseria sp. S1 TaxID=3318354 RepID=UPI003A83F8C6